MKDLPIPYQWPRDRLQSLSVDALEYDLRTYLVTLTYVDEYGGHCIDKVIVSGLKELREWLAEHADDIP